MNDPKVFYVGWLLDERDRARLLKQIKPRYAEVVAHHVTLKFGDREARPPVETVGEIVGEADDSAGVQALVVRIGGTTDRPDGSTYHVTWSLRPGRRAKESNDLIAQRGWRVFDAPLPVRLHPKSFGD